MYSCLIFAIYAKKTIILKKTKYLSAFKYFVESSGKCKISKYFYKTRFLGLKTLIFCAVYH